jgi:hypothetical protein
MDGTYDVCIVGAGAAGLATAIFAARKSPRLRMVLLDGARKVGAKILVSGGGRCNVTNVRVRAEDFWGGSRNSIRRVLKAFSEAQTVEFFRELGVPLHEEQWGKLFPDSHSAKTVLHALLAEADTRGIRLLSGRRVTAVGRADHGPFEVVADVGRSPQAEEKLQTKAVILATGGMSLPKTGSDGLGHELARRLGHSIVPPTPGLAPLVLFGDFHAPLSGVSHEVEVIVNAEGQEPVRIAGPMLWTHFGASGPAIMDASRHWHRARVEGKNVEISLSFLPGWNFEMAERKVLDLAGAQPKSAVRSVLSGLMPSRLAEAIAAALAVPSQLVMSQLTREDRRRIIHALLHWPLPVIDSRGYNYAEVTAGGVPLTEIDPGTMASRICPGLFLVGEILDVDGRIGGFNFQWAWSTAYVCAHGVARLFADDLRHPESEV